MSSFSGLNNARRAMSAQLKSMEVAGQNIANVNTPGYSRQIAHHATVILEGGIPVNPEQDVLSLAGVEVAEIRRQYDAFLDARLRQLTSNNNESIARYDNLTRLEELLHEPGDATIGTALEDLWKSFAQLTSNPTNNGARNDVLFRVDTVAITFRNAASEAVAIRNEAGERVLRDVERLNALVASLKGVNERLVATSATGTSLASPNALLDQRDALLREISQYANVNVTEMNNNSVRVTLGGRTLLDGQYSANAELVNAPDGTVGLYVSGERINDAAVGGTIGGELLAHNQDIPKYIQMIDDLARSVIAQVNAVHATGYDPSGVAGGVIFTGTSATDIARSTVLTTDTLAVSEAADGTDGKIAQRLADLRETPAGAATTILFQYSSMVSQIGSEVASMEVTRDNNQILVEFAEARAESVSGVSLDEELTDMVRFQQAYAAAARVLTSIDEALDVLINRTGQVGR